MRVVTIVGKTVADLANPRVLVGYFVPFLAICGFLALVISETAFEETGQSLAAWEATLHGALAGPTFFLVVGVLLLGLVAVFAALTIGKETETGTVRLLLSKPVSRWEYYVGTFVGVVTYGLLVGVAGFLLMATMVVLFSGVPAAAIPTGIFDQVAGTVAFALFGVAVIAGIGFGLAVSTNDKLRTALGALTVPAMYFAFMAIRGFAGASYEEYSLYLVDVNYHFGNAYVFFHELFGGLPTTTKAAIAGWTGVYDMSLVSADEIPETIEPVGHVPVEASVLLLATLGLVGFVAGLARFRTMDV